MMKIGDEVFVNDEKGEPMPDCMTFNRLALNSSSSFTEWFEIMRVASELRTDENVAKKLDVTRSCIEKWKTRRVYVYKYHIAALCWAFGCTELVDDVYEKFCSDVPQRGKSFTGSKKAVPMKGE